MEGSDTQASTAVWKLASLMSVKAVAMLVETKAKRAEKFVYFMTVIIGEGMGARGELSYELGNAWGNESSL